MADNDNSTSTSRSTSTGSSLEGRVAIVIGASRVLGREISLHLAHRGAKLLLHYAQTTEQGEAQELASIINRFSSTTAITCKADVSMASEVANLFDRAEQKFGKVHILVNSAGVMEAEYHSIAETPEQVWDSIFNANCKPQFLCSREAANRLVRDGGGRIINMSNSVVVEAMQGVGAYAASLAAVETMTRTLAAELKGKITANCIDPGFVRTDLFLAVAANFSSKLQVKGMAATPAQRLGEVSDVAPLVAFLASDDGEWINAQVIRINGGFI